MTQIYPPPPAVTAQPKEDLIERTLSLAQELYELPSVTSARFIPSLEGAAKDSTTVLQVSTSARSLSGLNRRSATTSVILSSDNSVLTTTPAVAISEEVKHVSSSPDGNRQALFRVVPAKEGKEQRRIVEVVDVKSGRKESEVEVTKEHGDWYLVGTFGPPSWHPSSHALVYTAEAPAPEPNPKATRPTHDKFRYEPDWGETFGATKRNPTLFLLVLPESPLNTLVTSAEDKEEKPTVHRLTDADTVPSTWFGQPIFLPSLDEKKLLLAATGYSAVGDGRKLGIVYCQNRPATIYALSVAVKEEKTDDDDEASNKTFRVVEARAISSKDSSSRSPRLVPTASSSSSSAISSSTVQILHLSNRLGGPHASCAQLVLTTLYLSSFSSTSPPPHDSQVAVTHILVPIVASPDSKHPGAGTASDPFPGLYVDQLPLEPCLVSPSSGEVSIAFSSIWRSRRVPLVVELQSGKVTSLAPWPEKKDEQDTALPYLHLEKAKAASEDALGSFTVLGTDGKDRIVALRSSPVSPPQLVISKPGVDGNGAETGWKVVRESGVSKKLASALTTLTYTVLPLPKFDPTELILVSPISIDPTAPSTPNLPPVITQAHGGPRSCVVTEWNISVAANVIAGYRFVHVNYPGSLGFGQDAVDSLTPRLGELEVEATLAAPHYLNSLSLASRTKGKRLLMGGSHGGWIACHLTARWPEEFDAVVMRNPVTDLVANAGMTDIPDWCYAECDLPYEFSSPPSHVTPTDFARHYDISPLRHAHAVKTPTLLLIGADDRRVPPDQGRTWFHALQNREKGNEVDVEMLKFPGNGHPIAETVEAEWVAFEQGLRWLVKYTDFS